MTHIISPASVNFRIRALGQFYLVCVYNTTLFPGAGSVTAHNGYKRPIYSLLPWRLMLNGRGSGRVRLEEKVTGGRCVSSRLIGATATCHAPIDQRTTVANNSTNTPISQSKSINQSTSQPTKKKTRCSLRSPVINNNLCT